MGPKASTIREGVKLCQEAKQPQLAPMSQLQANWPGRGEGGPGTASKGREEHPGPEQVQQGIIQKNPERQLSPAPFPLSTHHSVTSTGQQIWAPGTHPLQDFVCCLSS